MLPEGVDRGRVDQGRVDLDVHLEPTGAAKEYPVLLLGLPCWLMVGLLLAKVEGSLELVAGGP